MSVVSVLFDPLRKGFLVAVFAGTVFGAVVFLAPHVGFGQDSTSPTPTDSPTTFDEAMELAIKFSDVKGGVAELRIKPGDTESLAVQLRNATPDMIETKTFPANPQTMINGGFAITGWDDPATGASKWVDYPKEEFDFDGKGSRNLTATVKVPSSAKPGQYVVPLVIQNAKPKASSGSGGISLGRITSQYVAIRIDVPGAKNPAATFGDASYFNNGSVVNVRLGTTNTGNQILRPDFELVLKNSDKEVLDTYVSSMQGFYTGTSTQLEMTLTEALPNGQYFVDATMTGGGLDSPVRTTDVMFTVDDGSNESSGGSPSAPLPLWLKALIGLALLALIAGLLWLLARKRQRAAAERMAVPREVGTAGVLAFLGDKVRGFKGDPVGQVTIAQAVEPNAGLDVVIGGEEHAEARSVALEAFDSLADLTKSNVGSAIVTPDVLDQVNAQGEAYAGPATVIAVDDPQGDLDAIREHYLSQKLESP